MPWKRAIGFLLKDPESGSYFCASFGDDSREWDPDPSNAWSFTTFESAVGGQVTWFLVKDKMLNIVPYQQAITEWEEKQERKIEEELQRRKRLGQKAYDLSISFFEEQPESNSLNTCGVEQPTTNSLNTCGVEQPTTNSLNTFGVEAQRTE